MYNRVFTILGICPGLREELLKRGWIEKLYPAQISKRTPNVENHKRVVFSEILKFISPNFLWTNKRYSTMDFKPDTYYNKINRIDPYDFTSKANLGRISDNIGWFTEDEYNLATFICPRSHVLSDAIDKEAFREEFRLTLCTSFLYYLTQMFDMTKIFRNEAKYKPDCLDFAINYVRIAINLKQHSDIDKHSQNNQINYPAYCFENFQFIFNDIMKGVEHIELIGKDKIDRYEVDIRCTMQLAKDVFPYIPHDGHHNFWILKSSASHCGAMIKLMNKEEDILTYVEKNRFRTYVVQKYMEKPMLIHNTKFDIRQYFMITMDGENFNIWFYRDCYFKLSGRDYNLNNTNEQIHITNHTVQKKYVPDKSRSPLLPNHNMLTLEEFLEYLKKIEKEEMWYGRIHPGMINCIRSIVRASFDDITYVKNNYELYGADFMINHDFQPILIEVNAVPDLRHSTESTKKVNTALVQDLVKVIVDLPNKPYCSTGNFENIWQFKMPNNNSIHNYSLTVEGHAMKQHHQHRSATVISLSKTSKNMENVIRQSGSEKSITNKSKLGHTAIRRRLHKLSTTYKPSIERSCTASQKRVAEMLDSSVKVLTLMTKR